MSDLPVGQYELPAFPRFGLNQFAARFPREPDRLAIELTGDVENRLTISREWEALPRVEQCSDFHCVTTWSTRGLRWAGVRFREFYERIVLPLARPEAAAAFVIFRGQDGYGVSLPLGDLLADDVLLADELNGQPLTIEHGAPLRLVAPAHYGYKNPKHLRAIGFWRDGREYRPAAFRLMDHPRARVALEERGRVLPGWLLRFLYRPLVGPTIRRFRAELVRHRAAEAGSGK